MQQNPMVARGTAGLQHFVQHYRQQQQQHQKIPPGWQQSTPPEERGQLALQFFTQYRLLKPEIAEVEAMRSALQFETQNFMAAQTKDQYIQNVKQKLIVMTTARQQQLQRLQGNLGTLNGGLNVGVNPMNQGQMNMMGQLTPQAVRQGTPQQFNPAFPNPQLQRPMQISPVPMSQSQNPMPVNGANQGQNNQQPNMQPNQNPPRNPQEQMIINQFTKRLMDTCKEEVRQKFQSDVQAWPDDKKQQLLNSGIEPLFFRFRQHAEMLYRRGALNPPPGPNQHAGMPQAGQPNRMQNQQMNMNQRQSNPDFDFTAITNQQMEAMRSQDQGAQVVPASNNPNGAQMNGFQGQNPQQGQPQNAALAQRQAAEAFHRQAQQAQQVQAQAQAQQAQARLEQQRQQQAQAQARNQNQLLQGQMGGGLNLPPGSQQSPAMPMLTRPMPPPGQSVPPGTPQQRPPQAHVPMMTPQNGPADPNLTALMREAQQRAAAVSQAKQPLTDQVRMNMMPADLDPSVKQQLLKVPEQQFRHILQNYVMNARRNGLQNGAFPVGQPNPGQNNMLFNQQHQPLQPGMPGQMLGGPNMANMANMTRPVMNLGQQQGAGQQAPMGQRAPMQNQQQRLASAQSLLQQNPGIIHATDPKPFPPNVLNTQIRQSLPPDVKTWFELKQWAGQNPALVPGVDSNKLLMLQVLHFQDIVRQSNGLPGVHTPQQTNGAPLAPPTQLTPNQGPIGTPQQQLNMQGIPPVQVTQQEVQVFRQRLQGQQANISDEQLRQYILAQKVRGFQQQKQKQQQQQQQQQQHQHHHQQQQQQMLARQAQQRAQGQQLPPSMTAQQPSQNRPATAQSQPTQSTPQSKAAPRSQQPPHSNAVPNKGTKRPNEDTVEASADMSALNAASQAPAMASSKSQPGLSLTQEQISKLTPAQQAQVKAQLLKAQDASNASNKMQQQRGAPLGPEEIRSRMNDPARTRHLRHLVEETEKSLPQRQPVQLAPQLRAALQRSLKEQLPKLKQVDQALRIFHASYDNSEPEPVIRQIIKARALIFQQINEADGTLHDQVTLTTDEFKNHMATVIKFVRTITEKMAQQKGQGTAAQPSQPPQGSSAPPAQLNAANLKIVEQQQRQSKPPSAPTTDRPPFPIGADSGHGAAHYFEGARPVTNLVLPEKKRAKLEGGSQTSTPGAKASPRVGSGTGSSPELKRQPPPDKQGPQKPSFRCKAADCEYSVRGFDTQAELEAHFNQLHAKIENPLQFALDSMAEYLDVDHKTGEPKVDRNIAKRPTKPTPAAPRAPTQSIKLEHVPNATTSAATPAGPQAAATPMVRVPTQPGLKASPSTNLLKTPQALAKVATPSTGAHGKATPTSMARQVTKEQPLTVTEPLKEEDQQPLLPMSLLDYSYEDTFAALDANGPFTVLDLKDEEATWALRSRPASPSTTPESSSKDTPSTRQSDISENDNLLINIDVKDADMPDAWAVNFYGNTQPVDLQLSDDLQNLGVMLPPMDSEDMMLFPAYSSDNMMDLDMLEKTMDSMGGMFDSSEMKA